MRSLLKISPVAVFLLAAVSAVGQMKSADVRVKVVDEKGKAVAGARIADGWTIREGVLQPMRKSLTTDASGAVQGKVEYYRAPVLLMAVDASGKRGGYTVLADEAALAQPITIKTAPLRPVRVRTEVTGWTDPQPARITMSVMLPKERVMLMALQAPADGTIYLPEGEYSVSAFSFDIAQTPGKTFTVGRTGADLGKIAYEMSPIAKAAGKAPPALNVTEAVGLNNNFQLSDLKGKWVLLEFWGFW